MKTLSIFTPCSASDRVHNFASYWSFSQAHAGELFESGPDLANKRARLAEFQARPIRSRSPLPDSDLFYRNYVKWQQNFSDVDRITLMLTCMYKFARHEYVGIVGAWEATPCMADCHSIEDKISRVHLAEEFSHIRLFHEMLRTFHLDAVEWLPPGPLMGAMYRFFPRLPGFVMDAPAFVTELMGMVFYQHLDRLFDELLAESEPEACRRLHELLNEIMVDELAHVGQRRNFVGPVGIRVAKAMVGPLMRVFFADLPESRLLFDVGQMVRDARAFDYKTVYPRQLSDSWLPSYCIAGNN